MGMGQYPVLSRGSTPPLLQTLVAPVLFQTFVAQHYYVMDLVAPALSQKPICVTNFVVRGAPRPCYKTEGFDPLPYNRTTLPVYRTLQSPCGILRLSGTWTLRRLLTRSEVSWNRSRGLWDVDMSHLVILAGGLST